MFVNDEGSFFEAIDDFISFIDSQTNKHQLIIVGLLDGLDISAWMSVTTPSLL